MISPGEKKNPFEPIKKKKKNSSFIPTWMHLKMWCPCYFASPAQVLSIGLRLLSVT